ncbi:MAG: hypothetical protein AAFO07_27570, partial [Bacteroidota bacterium]
AQLFLVAMFIQYKKMVIQESQVIQFRFAVHIQQQLIGIFQDDHFFILDKHGDQKKLGNNKYMVMAYEPIANGIEWRDAMEYLFNKYRNNANTFIAVVLVVMLVIAIFVALSLA